MPKKKQREDEQIIWFAMKLIGALAIVIVVAAGIDVSHATDALTKYYGRTL